MNSVRKSGAKKRKTGFQQERELVAKLWKLGFAVMRAPASGAKIIRAKYPDIVAIKNGKIFVFEVKTREKPSTIYIESNQINKIREFSKRAGGKAFIAVKIRDGSGWRFVPVEKLEQTASGNYKISSAELKRGLTLSELKNIADGLRTLTDFIQV